MSDIVVLVLKYLSAILATGLAVAGAWFYDFTLPDKDTGRRTMTTAGKRAFVVTSVSIAIAGMLTVVDDFHARSKEAAAGKVHEEDVRRMVRVEDYLKVIVASIDKLPEAEKQKVLQSLKGFHTPEELKQLYPDLYDRLNKAVFDSGKPFSNDEARPILNEAVARGVDARILSTSECAGLDLEPLVDPPYRYGREDLGNGRYFTFQVRNDSVVFGVDDDPQAPGDFTHGFRLVFDNGSQSDNIQCRNPYTKSPCEGSTTNPIAFEAYREAQKTALKAIAVDGGIIPLSTKADVVNKLFRCVEP